jgi:hypothetical protein
MAMNGRISRLERTYRLRLSPESDDAMMQRRIEALVPLIPTEDLRLLQDVGRAVWSAEGQSPEHQRAAERLAVLLETGEWPG